MKLGYWKQLLEVKRLLDLDNVPENGRLVYMSQDVYDSILSGTGLRLAPPQVLMMLGMQVKILNASDYKKGYIQMVWEGGSTYD